MTSLCWLGVYKELRLSLWIFTQFSGGRSPTGLILQLKKLNLERIDNLPKVT